MREKISNWFAGHLGSWAYFVGRCIADGFRDQMDELDEEEHKAAMQQEDEDLGLSGGFPPKDYGKN